MSNREKALDALQGIIDLTSCHTSSKVNDTVIELSETISRALDKSPEQYLGGECVSCFYSGMPGHSIPIETAREQYNACDSTCAACGRCQI